MRLPAIENISEDLGWVLESPDDGSIVGLHANLSDGYHPAYGMRTDQDCPHCGSKRGMEVELRSDAHSSGTHYV